MENKMDPAAFDAVAAGYDAGFTATPLGQLLRARVWRVLAAAFAPGAHVLELACGTGADAVWLAQRGVRVLATDGAAAMLAATAARAARAGVGDLVATRQLALQDVAAADALPADVTFDGVLSNFGGLNTVGDWRGLAAALAARVHVGGTAVLVPMGPVCPWETAWHVLHGEWETAVRRQRAPATAVIGGRAIPVWYPAARTLRRAFAPWFTAVRCESLGLWLPPSHLGHLVARHPRFFRGAARLEQATARWTGGWGDHYVLVLRRV